MENLALNAIAAEAPKAPQTPAPFSGFAPTAAQTYPLVRICALNSKNWAPEAFAFLEKVREALPPETKNFLLPKELSFFEAALTDARCDFVAGLFGKKLVGMAVLRHFASYAEALEEKAVTCPQDLAEEGGILLSQPISTLQSVAIDPSFKGYAVGKKLLDYALTSATEKQATALVAQASAANKKGRGLFERKGFKVAATWTTDAPRVLLSHQTHPPKTPPTPFSRGPL